MQRNLSQSKLLEILTSEIESLRKTTRNINEIAPEIDRQLKELKQTKLKIHVNTSNLEDILHKNEQRIRKYSTMPEWFIIIVTVTLLSLSLMCYILFGIVLI